MINLEEKKINVTVDLNEVFNFVSSDIFDTFLNNSTTLSNKIFIKEMLLQTINNMLEQIEAEEEKE